ncbi:MAG: hypothetical protein ACRDZY_05970, partial [Acidimicrobiales bacterium]
MPGFTCPHCGRTHYQPQDVEHGYCPVCHAFTGSCPLVAPAEAAYLAARGWREGLDYRVHRLT